MLDTATAFSYHNSPSSSQNTKGLFGNLALPTQLLSSSLVMLPLGGYFSQQPSPQEPEGTSHQQNTPSSPIPSHSTPQQPTHNNKRPSRRAVQQQKRQSFSSAIASTLVVGNILSSNNGNNNDNSDSNENNNTPAKKHSSVVIEGPNPHHRRKRPSNKINRKKIDQAIAFSAYSVEEDHQENSDCALELYLMALEHMLEALPIHEQSRKDALKNKLKEFMDRTGLTEELTESTNSSSSSPEPHQDAKKCECTSSTWSQPSRSIRNSKISHHIINAAITSAVALKQSPIPDAVSATVNYTMRKIKNIDETYGLQDKAWEISRTGINMALEIDQQYNVHEKVGNALFTGLAAAMKAGIAYKDSPSYRELKRMRDQYHAAGSNDNDVTCNETEECVAC